MSIAMIDQDPEIRQLRQEMLALGAKKQFSDVIQDKDGRTLQYIDLVMEGGGVLGLALVGYVHALEQAGLRFLSVGGTSAGSILALLLMACKERDEEKSPTLLDIVFNMDMASFVDGDSDAKDFSLLMAEGDLSRKPLKLLFKGAQVLDNIKNDLGLNPGDAFFAWLDGHLRSFGMGTWGALEKRVKRLPKGLRKRGSMSSVRPLPCDLGIIAADISTETKVEFPRMAPMYWSDPAAVSPAAFVRASMSIPLFFHPYRVRGIGSIPNAVTLWQKLAGYDGAMPEEVVFVDGGTMSNFPINLFHGPGIPTAPTFGVKLGPAKRALHTTGTIFDYGMNLFDSIRHYADYEFISKNQDYKLLIGHIDTSEHYWLNFFMDDREKLELFKKGMIAGKAFLEGFRWKEYKKVREKLKKGEV